MADSYDSMQLHAGGIVKWETPVQRKKCWPDPEWTVTHKPQTLLPLAGCNVKKVPQPPKTDPPTGDQLVKLEPLEDHLHPDFNANLVFSF